MPTIRLSVRELVEFLLRTGSIDSRFTGFDRANEGARIHRRLQKAAGEGYAAEVFLTAERTRESGSPSRAVPTAFLPMRTARWSSTRSRPLPRPPMPSRRT